MADYKATMSAYCGMVYDVAEGDERHCKDRIRRFLKRRWDAGYHIAKVGDWRFELTPPDEAIMVPDDAGIICLEEEAGPDYGACHICGCDDGWHEDGRGTVYCDCQCCAYCFAEPGCHNPGCPELDHHEDNDDD